MDYGCNMQSYTSHRGGDSWHFRRHEDLPEFPDAVMQDLSLYQSEGKHGQISREFWEILEGFVISKSLALDYP